MKRLVSLAALFLSFSTPQSARAETQGDYLILLHGIARSSASMQKMADHFEDKGYAVLNIDYPSTEFTMAELVEEIDQQVDEFVTDKARPVHFVGYSMGALITRGVLNTHRPDKLGRVVLLAPPNQGSEVADFLKDNSLYKAVYGPAGQELTTDQSGVEELLGEVDYELGVIAGDRSIDPVSSAIIPGKDDGKVSVERTKIDGMADHIVLHTTHTFIMKNAQVINQVEHFLSQGKFNHKKPPQTTFTYNQ